MDDLITALRVVAQHLEYDKAGTAGVVVAGAERLEQLAHENTRVKSELKRLKATSEREIGRLESELAQYRVAAYEIARHALLTKA